MQKKIFGTETMIVPVRSSRRIYSQKNQSFNESKNYFNIKIKKGYMFRVFLVFKNKIIFIFLCFF